MQHNPPSITTQCIYMYYIQGKVVYFNNESFLFEEVDQEKTTQFYDRGLIRGWVMLPTYKLDLPHSVRQHETVGAKHTHLLGHLAEHRLDAVSSCQAALTPRPLHLHRRCKCHC
jgi:hypothetical protein